MVSTRVTDCFEEANSEDDAVGLSDAIAIRTSAAKEKGRRGEGGEKADRATKAFDLSTNNDNFHTYL